MIYLDTAASYPILSEVRLALSEAFESMYANSASNHFLGEKVSHEINVVREQLADEIGAYPSEIIFTSGATESNNIAFKSFLLGAEIPTDKKHIVTTEIEHKCIFSICDYLKSLGYEITYVKPNKCGTIDVDSIVNAIRLDTALVSVMHVNNELGTINPIAEIGKVCFNAGVLFHSDAAQSFKKIDIDVDDLNVDIMSFSAHKIGGPKGIGAIYIRDLRKKHLIPVIHGAGQEDGLRGGTVAAPLIIGFGKAIEIFSNYYEKFKLLQIRSYLLEQLNLNEIKYQINGSELALESCVSLTLPNTNIEVLVRKNENELCLAQGSACSSKEIEPSHVLIALGLDRELADHTFRVSFSLDISTNELDFFIAEISEATTNKI
ncbi:cysteine desulfurase family protein [Colwellia sp. C1TZA3]|uniref:cysteine desulfurase family protein n=1 Tax=Colwellia sp. C1TZA3 TaxID=2508879 RepID=UPI0011B9E787|nr:cysteine desulfurase family protein [Colwellia sp. C1TZA3]TWX72202.1 cysteine desulfurase [Colwellia sp. C1TZA3]